MTGLFLVWVNTQPPNYGRDYLKQDMKAAGQSFTGLLSASYSTLFLLIKLHICTHLEQNIQDNVLWFVEKIHARNIKCIPFFTPLPSFLFLVVSCFCAACLREEFGGWGPFYLIADLRVFSVWCMLA